MTLIASILVLIALTGSAALAAAADPAAAGAELIGSKAPGWEGVEWLNSEPIRLEDLRGKVVLVRWWTDSCPYCRRSAPALNEFDARFARLTWGSFVPIRSGLTECLLSDIAENAASFAY